MFRFKEFLIAKTPTIRSEIPTKNSAKLDNSLKGAISFIKIAKKVKKITPEECPNPHEILFLAAIFGLVIDDGVIAIR